MGSSRFWLKMADVESKSIPHELPSSHWLKATGQCVLERYLSAKMSGISSLRLGHTGEPICNGGQTDKNVQNLVIR